MSYFAEADLIERLSGTNVTPTAGEVSAARAFAEGYVDAALTGKYVVPFSPVPELIKFIALDIAAYEVLTKHYAVEDPNVGDLIKQFWARATDTLAKLQDGRMSLHDEAAGDEEQEKRVLATRAEEDEVFTLPESTTGSSGSTDDW
jgi:phage gp36-like protein